MVNMPRSEAGARSIRYSGTAPLFATMADLFQYPLQEARNSCRNVERENKQFRSRWVIVEFSHAIPEGDRNNTLNPCAKCAAMWYLRADGANASSAPLVPAQQSLPVVRAQSPVHKSARLGA